MSNQVTETVTETTDLAAYNVAGLRKLAAANGIGTGGWRVCASRDQLIQAITLGHVPNPTASTPSAPVISQRPEELSGNRPSTGGSSRPVVDLIFPQIDPNFVVRKDVEELLEVVVKIPNGKIRNVLLTGPAGCGKTELVRHAAALAKAPLFDFNIALYREPIDLFGERGVADGKTFFMPSRFIEAIETPNAIILADEINRCTPQVGNGLLPLLDHRKQVFVEGLNRIVKVADNVTFFGTANVGTQFTGTFRLDEALASRFPYRVEVSYLSREEESALLASRCEISESDANALATVAETIRSKSSDFGGTLSKSVSTRELIAAGWLIAGGMSAGKSLTHTIVPNFDPEGAEASERAQVLQTVQLVCGL